jgi:ribosome-interacting GTPase 1
MEEVEEIGSRPNSIPISCQLKLNMDGLLERIWEMMALVRGQTATKGWGSDCLSQSTQHSPCAISAITKRDANKLCQHTVFERMVWQQCLHQRMTEGKLLARAR